ncbi:MAG: double-cubane-cluster-containing anaerobic reductase [Rikenellaceae bacterium]
MKDNLLAWKKLGMDIDLHNMVLEFVGGVYGGIYMSQKNRPERMDYFDLFMSDLHGKRTHELMEAQQEGRKVVGTFCVFVPEELVIAANAIQVGLCAGAEMGFDKAEHYVPRNTCALIKSAFGFNLSKVCPFIEVSDMIVGENTCDGKKKSFEQYATLVKNEMYVLDLPQVKTKEGKALLAGEYNRFKEKLEQLTGNTITAEKLKAAIEIINKRRTALLRLADLRKADPCPISGLDVLLINQIAFLDDPTRFTTAVNTLCDELEQRVADQVGVAPKGTPRIVISGCPMAVPNWKVPSIIETSSIVIVGEETCTGERGTRNLVEYNAESLEAMLEGIVDRYFKVDCAIFSPNQERFDHITEMVEKYNADGVIQYTLQCCQPYGHESMSIERELEARGVAALSIETDYSQEDMGQLKTRVEAFGERITK